MLENFMNKTVNIGGMTCVSCENKIEKGLNNIEGIINVIVFYSKGTATITYDSSKISMIEIEEAIEMLGYRISSSGQEVKKKKYAGKMMISAALLVALLGVLMFNNGMSFAGIALPTTSNAFAKSEASSDIATAVIKNGIQTVTTTLSAGGYEPIKVQAGIPVKWNIQADKNAIDGCNNKIIIPEYNIEKSLEPGDNIIEFTPTKNGTVAFSCWMGMINSQIFVYDNLEDQSQVLPAGDTSNLPNCCNL